MVRKTQTLQEIAFPVVVEESRLCDDLRANLAIINKREDVLGYILRNATTVTIDIKDSARIFEYAILSSQAMDSGKELSALFNLGPIENVVIQGENVKVLCTVVGEQTVAVFAEKDANHVEILKKVCQ